ncbi:hypothetical protein CDAR_9921 [Caerostris darwini]|uniref:Uncharacterized protein n=1 Tax=Caerostris darwini TaxID=1538125 RepID=A0AAV4R071_9ARAC|nr:hypothetical protein CDAR_9921 [Caerostris darwini]
MHKREDGKTNRGDWTTYAPVQLVSPSHAILPLRGGQSIRGQQIMAAFAAPTWMDGCDFPTNSPAGAYRNDSVLFLHDCISLMYYIVHDIYHWM